MATFTQIITGAQEIIGEVAGPGVQQFSEDRMFADAKRAFNMIFTKYAWEQYTDWIDATVDGSTGLVTTNVLEYVRDFQDFMSVNLDGNNTGLPLLPKNVNPSSLGSGAQAQFWTSLAATHTNYLTKRLKFYPITSTSALNIQARIYPIKTSEVFTTADEIHLDRDLMTYATAFMSLAFEDLNVGAAEACKGLLEQRFKDIMANIASHPIAVQRGGFPSSDWVQV